MGYLDTTTKTITGIASLIQNTKNPNLISDYSELQIKLLDQVTKLAEYAEENTKLRNALKLKKKLTPYRSACYVCDKNCNVLEGPYCIGCAANNGIGYRLIKPVNDEGGGHSIVMCPNCKIKIDDFCAADIVHGTRKILTE